MIQKTSNILYIYCLYSNKLLRVVFNGYIVYHDHVFYFYLKEVGVYWNKVIY